MEKSFEQRVAEARDHVPAVSPETAHAYRQSDPTTVFIDPRDTVEIEKTTGRIPGALNVPLDDLASLPDAALPRELASPARRIITACQGGPMGALAARALQLRGFSNVAYMEGGTQGWLQAGYATVR